MSHDDFFAELGIQRDEDAGDAKDKPKSRRQRRMEKVERRQRKRRRHWLTSLVIVITLVAVGVLGYKAIGIMRDASAQATHAEDYKGEGEGEVTVTIPEGASGADIGDILQSKGVVASGKAFTNAAKNNPKGSTIQPGTYKLKKKMSANSALQALLDPESKGDHTLTIPAGVSKQIVKDRLKKVGSFTDEQIEAAYADSAAIGLPAEAGGNVEGWLAPGTYDVTENATPKDLVKKMVSQTVTQLKELQVPKEDYQKVLTKASIVEREVNSERYYGQAARVIENRLSQTDGETHGLLQMDSTVQYGLGRPHRGGDSGREQPVQHLRSQGSAARADRQPRRGGHQGGAQPAGRELALLRHGEPRDRRDPVRLHQRGAEDQHQEAQRLLQEEPGDLQRREEEWLSRRRGRSATAPPSSAVR